MKILSKIKRWWYIKQLHTATREKAHVELHRCPMKEQQVLKEIDCLINGHQWSSEFDPTKEITKPLTKRVYCKHCGVYYHSHIYKS